MQFAKMATDFTLSFYFKITEKKAILKILEFIIKKHQTYWEIGSVLGMQRVGFFCDSGPHCLFNINVLQRQPCRRHFTQVYQVNSFIRNKRKMKIVLHLPALSISQGFQDNFICFHNSPCKNYIVSLLFVTCVNIIIIVYLR